VTTTARLPSLSKLPHVTASPRSSFGQNPTAPHPRLREPTHAPTRRGPAALRYAAPTPRVTPPATASGEVLRCYMREQFPTKTHVTSCRMLHGRAGDSRRPVAIGGPVIATSYPMALERICSLGTKPPTQPEQNNELESPHHNSKCQCTLKLVLIVDTLHQLMPNASSRPNGFVSMFKSPKAGASHTLHGAHLLRLCFKFAACQIILQFTFDPTSEWCSKSCATCHTKVSSWVY
jgi:hypothetical protein